MDANDFVIELASANIPRLSYFDFKDKIQKRYKNLDNDDIGDLFTLYNKERNNNERRATDFLKKLIDENKAADGKSEAQLFQLASFRDRQYLVNKNEHDDAPDNMALAWERVLLRSYGRRLGFDNTQALLQLNERNLEESYYGNSR